MAGQICPFHADESCTGRRLDDGSVEYVCERASGHPTGRAWGWIEVPEPPSLPGLGGLGEELRLDLELPAALGALGPGRHEYGLVERSYAQRCPADFARLVEQWGHTAIQPVQYSASTYLALTLGRLGKLGSVVYHAGRGTGRWSYNSDISYWSSLAEADSEMVTTWVEVVGDNTVEAQKADLECKGYVLGLRP